MRSGLAALAILLIALPAGASAQPAGDSLTTRYTISLFGLPVGRAEFRTTIGADAYSVSGTLGSAGIADFFAPTTGTSSVSGRVVGDALAAERFRLDYTSDDEAFASDVRIRSAAVVSAEVAPPPRSPPREDYVPLAAADLQEVVDPLSGLMIRPGEDPSSICRRTLPLFDGWARIDLQLAPAGTRDVDIDGYAGRGIVCAARIVPVSGYRSGSSGIRYLREQTLQLTFAPAGNLGIWAPIHVRVPTKLGPLSISATTFARP